MTEYLKKPVNAIAPYLKGWTVARLLYLVMGLLIITQSIYEAQYFGLAFGGYFMAMAVFNFGCAAGGCCYVPNNNDKTTPAVNTTPVEFEEIKSNR